MNARVVTAPARADGQQWLGLLAATTLCVLAYKGFTTITNQGDDLREPKKNLPRSIYLSIGICAALYLVLTVAVTASLDVPAIIEARDYAIAAAAEPLFGSWGVNLTILIAAVATISGLLASIYAVSRLYQMLHRMGHAPLLPISLQRQPVLLTAGLAMITTVFLDLTQIASIPALLRPRSGLSGSGPGPGLVAKHRTPHAGPLTGGCICPSRTSGSARGASGTLEPLPVVHYGG